jgi:hypothetical protein
MSFKLLKAKAFAAFFIVSSISYATSYRVGGSLGLGGTGIQALSDISTFEGEENIVNVKRANSPGVISLYVERAFSPSISLAAEHFRGFKLAPFASGVHFSGLVLRYFITPIVQPAPGSSSVTTIHLKRLSFFAGASSGVAIGKIERQGDLVPEVNSSGVFFSGRLGADYSISPSFGLRSEVIYGFTLISSGANPSNMQQFGLTAGIFFFM